MIDHEELKKLAQAVGDGEPCYWDCSCKACEQVRKFHAAASPSVVLELLAEIETLEDRVIAWKEETGAACRVMVAMRDAI